MSDFKEDNWEDKFGNMEINDILNIYIEPLSYINSNLYINSNFLQFRQNVLPYLNTHYRQFVGSNNIPEITLDNWDEFISEIQTSIYIEYNDSKKGQLMIMFHDMFKDIQTNHPNYFSNTVFPAFKYSYENNGSMVDYSNSNNNNNGHSTLPPVTGTRNNRHTAHNLRRMTVQEELARIFGNNNNNNTNNNNENPSRPKFKNIFNQIPYVGSINIPPGSTNVITQYPIENKENMINVHNRAQKGYDDYFTMQSFEKFNAYPGMREKHPTTRNLIKVENLKKYTARIIKKTPNNTKSNNTNPTTKKRGRPKKTQQSQTKSNKPQTRLNRHLTRSMKAKKTRKQRK